MQKNTFSAKFQSTSSQTDLNFDSCLEDELPAFQLRLDDLTEYDEQDWIKTPVLSPDVKLDLSPQQCEETFKLFLLSGERLSQMTRTYNDIDALMHLLEEKEKDLELAARIGQTLLTKNRQVAEQKEMLEEKLAVAYEETSQLKYEVMKKEQLLNTYAEAELCEDSDDAIKLKNLQTQVNLLHSKIQQLENEKFNLLQQNSSMEKDHVKSWNEESQLVDTTVQQLDILQHDLESANVQILAVTDELSKRSTDSSKQQHEINVLLEQISQLQLKHKELINEHGELQQQLNWANTSQLELSQEVQSLECKYQEVLTMLDDTKEEMRYFRDSAMSSESDVSDFFSPMHRIPYKHSLASELKDSDNDSSSCNPSNELDDSHFFNTSKVNIKALNYTFPSTKLSKVDDDVSQTAQSTSNFKDSFSPILSMSRSLPLSLQPSVLHKQKQFLKSSAAKLESPDLGQPGVPGTADLRRAIEKLTRVGKESLKLVQQTRFHLLQAGKHKSSNTAMKKCLSAPKLRTVKPMEGSTTLHHWKNLADKSTMFTNFLSTSTASGVITRGNVALSTPTTVHDSASKSNSFDQSGEEFNLDDGLSLIFTTAGTSGSILSSPSNTSANLPMKLNSTESYNPFNFSKRNAVLKTLQSSPNLPMLSAAFLPSTRTELNIRAAACSPIVTSAETSTVELAQLHGCNNHNHSPDNTSIG